MGVLGGCAEVVAAVVGVGIVREVDVVPKLWIISIMMIIVWK